MDWSRRVAFFFDISGRMSRTQYWLGSSYLLLFCLVIISASYMIRQFYPDISIYAFTPFILLFAVGLVASHNMTVRRLHDIDQSGFWAFPLYTPFYILALLMTPVLSLKDITDVINRLLSGNIDILFQLSNIVVLSLLGFFALVYVLYIFAFLVELYFFKGEAGPNKYGIDPLEAYVAMQGFATEQHFDPHESYVSQQSFVSQPHFDSEHGVETQEYVEPPSLDQVHFEPEAQEYEVAAEQTEHYEEYETQHEDTEAYTQQHQFAEHYDHTHHYAIPEDHEVNETYETYETYEVEDQHEASEHYVTEEVDETSQHYEMPGHYETTDSVEETSEQTGEAEQQYEDTPQHRHE